MAQPSPSAAKVRLRLAAALLGCVLAAALALRVSRAPGDPPHATIPTPPTELTVRAVDNAGAPIAGAQIVAQLGDCRRATTTGAGGTALIPTCPGVSGMFIRAEAPGFARTTVSVAAGSVAAPVTLRLPPGGKLFGTVRDERGEPVIGATLSMTVAGQNDGSPENDPPWTVITSDTGGFSIDTISSPAVAIEVSSKLHERTVLPSVALPLASPLEVVLPRTAAIVGVVRRGQALGPGAGAEVLLAGSGVWPARSTKSDSKGVFRFEPVHEGIYELRALLGDEVSEPIEGLVVEAGQMAKATLDLAAGAAIRGLVTDARSGIAIPEAEVAVSEDALTSRPRARRAGPDGAFELTGLRAVEHRLTVRAPGYVDFESSTRPGGPAVAAALLRAGAIVGTVRDEQGGPVPKAELEVRGQSEVGKPVRLGAAAAMPAQSAPSPGAPPAQPASAVAAVLLPAGDNLGVTQGRVPPIPLTGPVPTALVALTPSLANPATSFITDDLGNFRLDGLPPGVLRVIARKAGYAPSTSVEFTLRSGGVQEDVTLTLSRGGAVVGRVLDNRGGPVAHVRVELKVDGDPEAQSALSGDDGTFRFEALHGKCALTAYPYGLPPVSVADVVVLPKQESTVTLTVDGALHTLEGRVLNESARPIEQATVALRSADARSPLAITVLSGPDGRFEIAGLPAPPYRVTIEHAEYAASLPVKIAAVAEPLVITLVAGSELRGVVTDETSEQPLPAAGVQLMAAGRATRTARLGADGAFEFRHVTPGDYSVSAAATGFIEVTRKVIVAPGAVPEIEEFALVPAGSASGDVVDRLGQPLWNAEVTAGTPPQWSKAARTDHAGHFVLTGLAPGAATLSAREASAGSVIGGAAVRVYARQESPGVVLRLPNIGGGEQAPVPTEATGKPRARKRGSDAR